MEANPGSPPPKRARAKAASPSAETKEPRKTLSTTRKKSKEPEPEPEIVSKSLAETDLRVMIETAAFYRAAARSFAPGHELEDWLEAERQILAQYA